MAKHYAHTGMVGLDGEKMSKSLGNLVLVSKLRADGVEPAAIRLAILANHYRSDWFWTEELLGNAQAQLATWRDALHQAPEGSAAALLAELRAALAADLDAPRALAAVDAWASCTLTAHHDAGALASERDSALIEDAICALLGVEV